MQDPSVADVLRRHAERLMAVPGVVGTAEGRHGGRARVLVLVERRTAAILAAIPDELEGVRVEIVETGAPEAFDRP
jgi:hypothetical protein